MTLLERLKTYPGFVYKIGNKYYFLGKWICKPCTDQEITDCRAMYDICASAGETDTTRLYFQKLRAYSDFALEVPCNPGKVHKELSALLEELDSAGQQSLAAQLDQFDNMNGDR